MLVKKKKKAFAFPDAEFPSWQNETHETHKTVCVCVCVRTHTHVHMRVWLSQYPECNSGLNFKKQYSAFCFCLHDFTP